MKETMQIYTETRTKTNERAGNNSFLLDTLAQPGTEPSNFTKKSLTKRAKRKYISNAIVFNLVDLNSPLRKSYWNTFYCSSRLIQEGQKVTGHYCNNRWCLVCNGIRTAKMIKGYLPAFKEQIPDPYSLTLTIPNVPGDDLSWTIKEMIRDLIRINNTFRRRRGIHLVGIRKLEITYNAVENTFHPHFHFVLNGKSQCEELIDYWLACNPSAERFCQKIRKADQGSLIELFKYTTKIVTKNDKIVEGSLTTFKLYPEALDIIFKALKGRRAFQPMGLKKVSVSEDIDEIQAEDYKDIKAGLFIWKYVQDLSDWANEFGEFLTGCQAYKQYKILNYDKQKEKPPQ